MKIIVNPHKIEIDKDEAVNEREIDISRCEFEFSEEITDDYVKEAYFTFKDKTYKQIIVNNQCAIPSEVLAEKGTIQIGVVAYLVESDEEIKRYNPSPAYFDTWLGSLKDNAENSQSITPSEMEQYEQALNDGLVEVSNVNIDATKEGEVSTVTITNRKGVTKTVEIYDGEKGETGETGEPGKDAKINGVNTINIEAGENITLEQEGNTLTINSTGGSGKVESVNGKIGDVVLTTNDLVNDSGYINKNVNDLTNYELKTDVGHSLNVSINSSTYVMTMQLKNSNNQVISTQEVDLPLETMVVDADYDSTAKEIVLTLQSGSTTRFSVADLVSGLQTEITSTNKLDASFVDDSLSNNKFVTTAEKTAWNGKQETIQYSTMPTAGESYLGQIVQYTGTTDTTYTNGYFYICTTDGSSYNWENINVQAGGGSGTDVIHYMNDNYSTTTNPFVLEGKEPGVYYFDPKKNSVIRVKGLSSYAASRTLAEYSYVLYIVKKYEDAEVGENVAYTGFTPWEKTSSAQPRYVMKNQTLQKLSVNPGVNVNDVRTRAFNLVNIDSNETIWGIKTFGTLPQSSQVPTNDNDLVNKAYVDAQSGGGSAEGYNFIELESTYSLNDVNSLSDGIYILKNSTENAITVDFTLANYAIEPEGSLAFIKTTVVPSAEWYKMVIFDPNNETLEIVCIGGSASYWLRYASKYDSTYNTSGVDNTNDYLTNRVSGYDSTKTQVLKNVNGTITWVDE